MQKCCLLLLMLLGLGATAATAQNKVPAIQVQTPEGKKVDFSAQIQPDKINVISFWATWCGPCKKELNNIKTLYPEWQEKYNINLIAVSIDDSRNFSKVKPYIDGQRWTFTSFVDANSDLKRAMNFQSVPHTVVVDKKGNIVWEHDGYTEGDEFELEEVIKKMQ